MSWRYHLLLEERFVLAFARSDNTPQIRAEAETLLQDGLRWDIVKEKSESLGVAPLLFLTLQKFDGGETIPSSFLAFCKEAHFATAARNLLFYSELRKILQALSRRHIPVIVLKGAALAQLAYPSIALRSMVDIDVLIEEKNVNRVDEILKGIHYDRIQKKDHDYESYHWSYLKKNSLVPLEVHWAWVRQPNPFRIDIEELFNRARTVNISDTSALVLDPEDTVLHLCLHLFIGHFFANGLKGLIDINQILEKSGDFNWPKLVKTSSAYKISGCVYYPLRLARELLDSTIPSQILDELKPTAFRNGCVRALMGGPRDTFLLFMGARDETRAQATILQFILCQRLGEAVKAVLRILFPPVRFITCANESLNSFWRFFFYVLRPAALFIRYGVFLFKQLSSKSGIR